MTVKEMLSACSIIQEIHVIDNARAIDNTDDKFIFKGDIDVFKDYMYETGYLGDWEVCFFSARGNVLNLYIEGEKENVK